MPPTLSEPRTLNPEPSPDLLADGYPPEAFVSENGKMLPSASWQMDKFPKALAARARTLEDVAVPVHLLRKGVNVLAVEVVRAPYNRILDEKKNQAADKRELANRNCPYELSWNTCEVRRVQLTAGSAAGILPNASRPKGLQVWNGDLLTNDYTSDFGDRCEALRPVELKGPGNGYISGKVVIGSSKAIEGLKVTCGDLQQEGRGERGEGPAARVQGSGFRGRGTFFPHPVTPSPRHPVTLSSLTPHPSSPPRTCGPATPSRSGAPPPMATTMPTAPRNSTACWSPRWTPSRRRPRARARWCRSGSA